MKVIVASLAVDATVTPKAIQLAKQYKAIIGGGTPNHLIALDTDSSVLDLDEQFAEFMTELEKNI